MMKFVTFTDSVTRRKVSVCVYKINKCVELGDGTTNIWFATKGEVINVLEDHETVTMRLNAATAAK